jgi:hypothetical protein
LVKYAHVRQIRDPG